MKRTILLAALFCCALEVFAEGELDAVRLSGSDLRGTARGIAMGGAFGALGGDVTGIGINPAGLGVYRSSEINASLGLTSANTKTDLQGDYAYTCRFDNVSFILNYPSYTNEQQSVNFAISYNRLKNFDRNYQATAFAGASLTDYIAGITTGYDGSTILEDLYNNNIEAPWLGILGYDGYIIDLKNPTSDIYEGLFPGERPKQRLNVKESGGIYTWDFSLGGNYADKFYWGATLSLTDISYYMSSTYNENFSAGDYTLSNSLESQGSGFQLALGAIFKPINALRLGISYHSPTWYSMTNYFSGSLITDYSGIPNRPVKVQTPSSDNFINYRLHTPYNWTFSAAAVIGSKAILSLDYEIKDYKSMHLGNADFTDNGFQADNDFIKQDYKAASTVRVGGEYRFTPQLSGRIGYAWMQNPYNQSFASNPNAYNLADGYKRLITGTVPHFIVSGDTHNFTAGIGYRFTPQFYMDLAFVYRTQIEDLYYFPAFETDITGLHSVKSDAIALNNATFKGLLTVGLKF